MLADDVTVRSDFSDSLILTHSRYRGRPLEGDDAAPFTFESAERAARFLARVPGYSPTPLHSLPALARQFGIGSIHVKDEGRRFGLGSFKGLGGAYAVIQIVVETAARNSRPELATLDWRSLEVAAAASKITVACATSGNHGRSVARGAQLVGAHSVIFAHAGVSDARCEAIARFGATVIRNAGDYGDAVAEAERAADANGLILISDTSWPGYERIPRLVMQGYTVMLREALAQNPEPPTHVFVQAGVGGLAAAIAAHFEQLLGEHRPFLAVIEPARSACLFESARLGRRVRIAKGRPTVMAMLECNEPSLVAWRILSRTADAFMTVKDKDAVAAMKRLAFPLGGDPAILAGESGAAGLAGLMKATGNPAMRAAFGLGPAARVLLINSEGATDPALYAKLVGLSPGSVDQGGES